MIQSVGALVSGVASFFGGKTPIDEFAKFELEAYILSMQSNYLMEIK
jgi:hypothetical protein